MARPAPRLEFLTRSLPFAVPWPMLFADIQMPDTQDETFKVAEDNPTPTELAHSIIESLLDHTRVVSDLIAVMAQALDEDTQRALTQTSQWQAYLESRRRMEITRGEVEKFAELIKDSPVG